VAGYSLVPGQEVELGLAVANNKAHPQATPFLTTALLQIVDLDVEADADASAALPYPPHSSATSSRVLVRGLSLTVPPGMRLLVTGPSGSGKSTLVRKISEAVRAEEDVEHTTHLTSPRRDAVINASVVLGIPLTQLTICPQRPYLFKVRLPCKALASSDAAI
jgi:ABC-type microcin C transport system duplicated ATPase subunit YejF